MSPTAALRALIKSGTFLHLPSVYDPITARLVQQAGFEATYVGGYVSGGTKTTSEPLLTMTEQVAIAGEAAAAVTIPVLADAGAGFGEPLHTMRTVREFARAGIAGVHIEDQLFPKRAHYHKYQVHAISPEEFATKIRYACRARDEVDADFLIIARSDTCRELGLRMRRGGSTAPPRPAPIWGCCSPDPWKRRPARPRSATCPWFMCRAGATVMAGRCSRDKS